MYPPGIEKAADQFQQLCRETSESVLWQCCHNVILWSSWLKHSWLLNGTNMPPSHRLSFIARSFPYVSFLSCSSASLNFCPLLCVQFSHFPNVLLNQLKMTGFQIIKLSTWRSMDTDKFLFSSEKLHVHICCQKFSMLLKPKCTLNKRGTSWLGQSLARARTRLRSIHQQWAGLESFHQESGNWYFSISAPSLPKKTLSR